MKIKKYNNKEPKNKLCTYLDPFNKSKKPWNCRNDASMLSNTRSSSRMVLAPTAESGELWTPQFELKNIADLTGNKVSI